MKRLQCSSKGPKLRSYGAGVFGHPQVIKDQAGVARELAHFLGNAPWLFCLDEADGKTAEPGDVFRAVSGAYPASIFVIVPIDDVMATVFDAPVATVCGKDMVRVGLLGCATGYAVRDLTRGVTGFLLGELSLHEKCLSDMGKVQIVVEFGGGPDLSDFDPTVVRG